MPKNTLRQLPPHLHEHSPAAVDVQEMYLNTQAFASAQKSDGGIISFHYEGCPLEVPPEQYRVSLFWYDGRPSLYLVINCWPDKVEDLKSLISDPERSFGIHNNILGYWAHIKGAPFRTAVRPL